MIIKFINLPLFPPIVLFDHFYPHYLYSGYITGVTISELTLDNTIESNIDKKIIDFIIL